MSYFHSTASGHKRRNFIMEIKDDDETHTDQTVKGRIFLLQTYEERISTYATY
jgi:hypothetical protein